VVTLAGPMDGKPVALERDGPGASARFNEPRALAYDPAANVAYVADGNGRALRRLRFDAAGGVAVDTLRAGVGPYDGLLVVGNTLYATGADLKKVESFSLPDGAGPREVATGLAGPTSLAQDLDGNLLVADHLDNKVKRIAGARLLDFYGTGQARMLDAADAAEARVDSPHLLAVSPEGMLYVASFSEGQLHSVDLKTGRTGFVAGGGGLIERPDGFWANARIEVPRGLAFDPAGRLIVADALYRLRSVSLGGDVETVVGRQVDAGHHPLQGFKDGPADQALVGVISGVAVLPGGAALFTDANGAIREWLPQ
jgi:DNA-binding beta-propeller fold protein YncE